MNHRSIAAVRDFPPDGVMTDCYSGLRILLVEDDQKTRLALTRLLSARKHTIFPAATMAEARELAKKQSFDLLITVIGLPDGNGHELMAKLGGPAKLGGIAMTGYGMDEDIDRSRQVGFSAHLTKPVRVQSLSEAIRVAMTI